MAMAKDRKTDKPAEPRRLALKFISGKYQGGEFPLNEGQDVVVGRFEAAEAGIGSL